MIEGIRVQPENHQPSIDDFLNLMEDYRRLIEFIRSLISALGEETNSSLSKNLAQRLGKDWRTSGPLKQQVVDSLAQLHRAEKQLLYHTVKALADDQRWQAIAGRPSEFNRELTQILDFARKFMRIKYGIQAHRPTKQAMRDARIGILRIDDIGFPEIAKRLDMSVANCHLAHERFEERSERARESLNNILKFVETYPWLLNDIAEPPEVFI